MKRMGRWNRSKHVSKEPFGKLDESTSSFQPLDLQVPVQSPGTNPEISVHVQVLYKGSIIPFYFTCTSETMSLLEAGSLPWTSTQLSEWNLLRGLIFLIYHWVQFVWIVVDYFFKFLKSTFITCTYSRYTTIQEAAQNLLPLMEQKREDQVKWKIETWNLVSVCSAQRFHVC